MSEVERQRKRIDHMVVTFGKAPNVLDIEPSRWGAIIVEIKSDRRFRGCILPGVSPWNMFELSEEPEDVKQIELFGVRFCKGRV